MRPNEIRQLTKNYIYLSAEKSKTKKEKYVYINKNVKKLLKKMNVKNGNGTDLVFYLNKEKTKKPIGKNTLSAQHRKILDTLNIGKEHTLYSWKHTGNVLSYKKGIDIYSLMKQNGHTNINTTMNYLKSLEWYNFPFGEKLQNP